MSWESRVPATLDALVALFSGVSSLQGIVRDGPTVTGDAAQDIVLVGYTGVDDAGAADGTLIPEGMALEPNREQFSVQCAALSLRGNQDMGDARRTAYAMFAACGAALISDHTLGGLVLRAAISDYSLTQEQTDGGALASVLFSVACDAYTER